jgi:hypothetical protein
MDTIIPAIAAIVLYITALNLWGAAFRYRLRKGAPSSIDGPGWFTPIWRAGRWLEPRGVRLLWIGSAALVTGTILLLISLNR